MKGPIFLSGYDYSASEVLGCNTGVIPSSNRQVTATRHHSDLTQNIITLDHPDEERLTEATTGTKDGNQKDETKGESVISELTMKELEFFLAQ